MARDPSVFVHERALCESDDVGPRTRIWAFAHVMAGATIGADCNVGDHAFVESGARLGDRVTVKNGVAVWDKVTIEDEVFLGPNVVFTNDLRPRAGFKKAGDAVPADRVRRGATIGANATIVCGVTIGAAAFVGAGSVVTPRRPRPRARGRKSGPPHRLGLQLRRAPPRVADVRVRARVSPDQPRRRARPQRRRVRRFTSPP